jgi:hypothetical protein
MTPAKLKPSEVSPKIRDAIQCLLHQEKYDLAEAARIGGVTVARLRDDLGRPHVRAWMRQQKQLQLEQICQQNASALARIRDSSTNANAAVNSCRTLEAMLEASNEETSRPVRREAGLVIIIGARPQEPQQRLAGAKTVLEAGARDVSVQDEADEVFFRASRVDPAADSDMHRIDPPAGNQHGNRFD